MRVARAAAACREPRGEFARVLPREDVHRSPLEGGLSEGGWGWAAVEATHVLCECCGNHGSDARSAARHDHNPTFNIEQVLTPEVCSERVVVLALRSPRHRIKITIDQRWPETPSLSHSLARWQGRPAEPSSRWQWWTTTWWTETPSSPFLSSRCALAQRPTSCTDGERLHRRGSGAARSGADTPVVPPARPHPADTPNSRLSVRRCEGPRRTAPAPRALGNGGWAPTSIPPSSRCAPTAARSASPSPRRSLLARPSPRRSLLARPAEEAQRPALFRPADLRGVRAAAARAGERVLPAAVHGGGGRPGAGGSRPAVRAHRCRRACMRPYAAPKAVPQFLARLFALKHPCCGCGPIAAAAARAERRHHSGEPAARAGRGAADQLRRLRCGGTRGRQHCDAGGVFTLRAPRRLPGRRLPCAAASRASGSGVSSSAP